MAKEMRFYANLAVRLLENAKMSDPRMFAKVVRGLSHDNPDAPLRNAIKGFANADNCGGDRIKSSKRQRVRFALIFR